MSPRRPGWSPCLPPTWWSLQPAHYGRHAPAHTWLLQPWLWLSPLEIQAWYESWEQMHLAWYCCMGCVWCVWVCVSVCVCLLTWSRDSMNKSKLALSLLIPDLGQLGRVHLHGFSRLTVRRVERRRIKWEKHSTKKNWGKGEHEADECYSSCQQHQQDLHLHFNNQCVYGAVHKDKGLCPRNNRKMDWNGKRISVLQSLI